MAKHCEEASSPKIRQLSNVNVRPPEPKHSRKSSREFTRVRGDGQVGVVEARTWTEALCSIIMDVVVECHEHQTVP